ncbi:NPR2-domain-containing protein [Rhodofomes roseus]|uniref:NPR2-domain-containing protein n=1 Tax=Rhodofomes roseus TaxID=34475 RepID=A0ABQ8KVH4_9APHY|nr:NPR2-domain-containing protein [Rhodofomes roseus]KAH9843077.1 NPR2-domain-containing protein [Rhodofomes roseus]
MASSGSFFPRIESVFYVVFDSRQGPKIVYQVPEGLIATGPTTGIGSNTLAPLTPATPSPTVTDSPSASRFDSRHYLSPRKRSVSSNRSLFHFDDISRYVMPRSSLCGRLVICATKGHRIIGFPVELQGHYERNYFRYNLCFVFERSADLSCYEPVVRKVSRVLSACELESRFLSEPDSSPSIYAVLEQLYEDLNSYSETSIPLDKFNSIELKIFPFYPNPPQVKDWMVPLALIDIKKRIEPNWDLTMVKVCRYIDGTNHISRIARLADCDVDLTRQAIAHLLYYQVVMMIDIFQYSNMYTLCTTIQWLADETHVRDECGPYTTKPGQPIADWPKLLHLYSRLKPGKTVFEWMQEYDVQSYNIDVRRFTSFGVIKGFLRRVHRWPVLLPEKSTPQAERIGLPHSFGRKRGKSFTIQTSPPRPLRPEGDTMPIRGRAQASLATEVVTAGAGLVTVHSSAPTTPVVPHRARRASAAESSLEQLRNRETTAATTVRKSTSNALEQLFSPRLANTVPSSVATSHVPPTPRPPTREPSAASVTGSSDQGQASLLPAHPGLLRPRVERSPSAPVVAQVHAQSQLHTAPAYPKELLPLLDGEHHTDELCARFEVGWPMLRQWLVMAGGGKDYGDFGQVAIIYR